MSFHLKISKVELQLIFAARTMVYTSILKTWDNCRLRKVQPEEPDFVASLVLNGTKILEYYWRKILKPQNIGILITGVYCHQTPKVKFNGMRRSSCELGDLLWCHTHIDRKGNPLRNAIIYQVKRCAKRPYWIHDDETDQLILYSHWPEFTYVTPKELKVEKRHITPAAPRRGAQYLLIDEQPPEHLKSSPLIIPGTSPMGSCISQNPLIDHADLGLELVYSLRMLSGDPFDEIKYALNDIGWSRMIWDLLLSSVNKAFRRARSGYFTEPRISGASPSDMDGCFYMTNYQPPKTITSLLHNRCAGSLFVSDMDNPPKKEKGEWFDEVDGGISIILVETHELEE